MKASITRLICFIDILCERIPKITVYQGPQPDRSLERISFVCFVIFIPLQRLPPSSGDYSIGCAKTKERPSPFLRL